MLYEITSYLTKRMKDNWDGCPIVYDNHPPRDMSEEMVWARFVVRFGHSENVSAGTSDKMIDQQMRIALQVFVARGEGPGLAYDETARFAALFQHLRYKDEDIEIEGRSPFISHLQEEEEDWFQVNSSIPAIGTFTVANAE